MKTFLKFLLVLIILGGLGAAAYGPAMRAWKARMRPHWRTAEVLHGDVVAVVNSTGTIKPVQSVTVGAFVSGPIKELYCEFNQEVQAGDLLAIIDPLIYQSNVDRDQASLASRRADVERAKATLQQAINDERRGIALRTEDPTFISQQEMDKLRFSRMSLQASLQVAEAAADQAEGSLENSKASLNYTKIKAPVSGKVINRKIDPGQTVAAQFQTPELFIIAPDMQKRMDVHASVDEADIGLITRAKERKLPVTFTVDAYPNDLFTGTIEEIRLSYTTTQNVVTYPVLVAAANPELKLLPGMTPSLSFKVDERTAVLKIPNAALRFFPAVEYVRPADRYLIEGKEDDSLDKEDQEQALKQLSAEERRQRRKSRNARHVWIDRGEFLEAVEVTAGISDSQYTALESGDLKAGDKLVTGIKKTTFGAAR